MLQLHCPCKIVRMNPARANTANENLRNTDILIRKSYNEVHNKGLCFYVHILGHVYLFGPAWSSIWVGLTGCSAVFVLHSPLRSGVSLLACSASKGHVHLRHLQVLKRLTVDYTHAPDVTKL